MTTSWTDADFDSLNWHDCHVHGIQIVEGEHGAGELWLDLDYILEWLCPTEENGQVIFRIAPAMLKFRSVFDLRMRLNYKDSAAAITPFSIDGIERSPVDQPSHNSHYQWTIKVNWPTGSMTFESQGFTQQLTGPVIHTDQQCLNELDRRNGATD